MPFATETSNSSLPMYRLRNSALFCGNTQTFIFSVYIHNWTQNARRYTLYAGVLLLRLGRIIELLTFRIAKLRSVINAFANMYGRHCNHSWFYIRQFSSYNRTTLREDDFEFNLSKEEMSNDSITTSFRCKVISFYSNTQIIRRTGQ